MNGHLRDDELIGNIHRTLTDEQRESMERHLTVCPQCRARLDNHETLQQHIRHTLLADLRAVKPSSGMRFATVVPHLTTNKHGMLKRLSHRLFPVALVLAGLIGLGIALMDLPESIMRLFDKPEPASASSLSALACVFFSVATFGHYRESRLILWRRKLYALLAFVIWLGTAVVGLQVMAILRDALSWFVLQVSFKPELAFALGNWALIPLGLVWIAVVIGGAEYQYRRGAQDISWSLFAWIIAVEIPILFITLLI